MVSVHTIVIAAINSALPSGLTGIADMLALAKLGLAKCNKDGQPKTDPWAPTIVTASYDGAPIEDGQGQKFHVNAALRDISHCEAVLIPGVLPDSKGHLPNCLTDKSTQLWLAEQHRHGALVCGSCSGAFALGEAGLLNGRKCTTTWWLYYELKRRFPSADIAWGSGFVVENRVITAGGPLSWIDITLHVIRLLAGAQSARIAADFAVVDTVPKSQSIYVPQDYLMATDPFLAEAEQIVRHALNRRLIAQDLAASMAVSERTLHRRLKELTGEAPKAFIDRLRIESACTLLQASDQPIKSIAMALGFSEETVFRRLFRRYTGLTPTGYRALLDAGVNHGVNLNSFSAFR